jgi:hypothetical protein
MTTSLPELGTLGSRVLFSVSGHYYTVADVVLAAAERGAWEAAWQMAGVGSEGTVDDGDLESAELSFRRARRLAAGDELRAWLAGWELTASEWRGFLRRELLRERHSCLVGHAADERTVLVHVVCSGSWVGGRPASLKGWRYGERGAASRRVFRAT